MGRPPIGKVAMTATERSRRHRAKPHATKCNETARNETATKPHATKCNETKSSDGDSRNRIRELEAALNHARARSRMFEEDLKNLRRKAAKPPLPPDEIRDRKIKAQATEIRNLKGMIAATMDRYREALVNHGAMDFRTFSAISFVLHPDTRDQAGTSDKDKALRGLNAWKADNAAAKQKREQGLT